MYAFAGVAGFWIDDAWALRIYPVGLLPLDGDHTGKAIAEVIFKALHQRKFTRKLGKRSCISGVVYRLMVYILQKQALLIMRLRTAP